MHDTGKAWALLMPNYVATKLYFTSIASTLLQQESFSAEPFFLVPTIKYDYVHPEGTGHSSSPFFSIWYIHMANDTKRVLAWWDKLLSKKVCLFCFVFFPPVTMCCDSYAQPCMLMLAGHVICTPSALCVRAARKPVCPHWQASKPETAKKDAQRGMCNLAPNFISVSSRMQIHVSKLDARNEASY
eukprot:366391-Chlamydomonas_euryale.AAC.19